MKSRKLSMLIMQKVRATSWFFITCLLIFLQHVLSYLIHIFIMLLRQF